jgi:hypothetical protein
MISFTGEINGFSINGFSIDDFVGNLALNLSCCFRLFRARNQESKAIKMSKNPAKVRIQPAKNRDLNKRIAVSCCSLTTSS